MKLSAIGLVSAILCPLCACIPLVGDGAQAGEIDARIEAGAGGSLAGPASDAEFLRRASLDFTGTIATAKRARAFLADADPHKRDTLIAQLLASPEFPRRMQEAVSVMWLERRASGAVPDDAWRKYLHDAFAANKPWNVLVRELVAADGTDAASQPAIRFLVDGGRADPDVATLDFARLFLGMNLACARCHDHPQIEDYKQAHFYGLYAYLSPTKLVNDKQQRPLLFENPTKQPLEFVSVFFPSDKKTSGPQLPDGPAVEIPTFAEGEEFAVPAADGLPGVPKFQPRKLLAEQLVSQRRFARNAVNRFWFLMFGRGLVHPLDFDHSQNPPSHPELLDELTDGFQAHDFDVRWLLQEIARSAAYQRSGVVPAGADMAEIGKASYRTLPLRPLSAEQLARGLAEALGQRARLDAATPGEKPISYKDYSNGRTEIPANWRDVLTVFAGAFGNPAGEAEMEFQPSVEHALFLANDRLIRDWLQPREGSLTARLNQIADPAAAADEIYLSLLGRPATDEERGEIVAWLSTPDIDRALAVQDIVLALITSAEFRLY
ncbi:MAG: DUF1549 domain-containing protein [Pirellulales bacterium]